APIATNLCHKKSTRKPWCRLPCGLQRHWREGRKQCWCRLHPTSKHLLSHDGTGLLLPARAGLDLHVWPQAQLPAQVQRSSQGRNRFPREPREPTPGIQTLRCAPISASDGAVTVGCAIERVIVHED